MLPAIVAASFPALQPCACASSAAACLVCALPRRFCMPANRAAPLAARRLSALALELFNWRILMQRWLMQSWSWLVASGLLPREIPSGNQPGWCCCRGCRRRCCCFQRRQPLCWGLQFLQGTAVQSAHLGSSSESANRERRLPQGGQRPLAGQLPKSCSAGLARPTPAASGCTIQHPSTEHRGSRNDRCCSVRLGGCQRGHSGRRRCCPPQATGEGLN